MGKQRESASDSTTGWEIAKEGRSTGFQIENVNTRAEADGMDLGGWGAGRACKKTLDAL